MPGVNKDENKKPGTGDQGALITLKVKGQDGSEMLFKIRRCTKLKKLMNAYCYRQRLNFVSFLFHGSVLLPEQTPHELEMEQGDKIDAVIHETTNDRLVSKYRSTDNLGVHITLKVKGQDGNEVHFNEVHFNEVHFRIRRSTKLKKLMIAYCDRQSLELKSIAFLFYGVLLEGEETPDELEMDDGDKIDVILYHTYYVQVKAECTALKEELNRAREKEQILLEEIAIRTRFMRIVSRLVNQVISGKFGLKEELTRLFEEGEEDVVFKYIGRLAVQLVAQDIVLMEELARLFDYKNKEEEDEDEDVVFLRIGRYVFEEMYQYW